MFVDCKETEANVLYKLLLGAVVPRPIAWVSTRSAAGVNNLAPFSFFNCFGIDPPMVGFAPAYKSIEESRQGLVRVPKDTLSNIEENRQFVINIVSLDVAEKMNLTSGEFPPEVSEFDVAGLTPVPSELVVAPRVGESLINMECSLIQVLRHGNNNLVLGEILGIHLDDRVVTERMHINADVLQAVGRMAGQWYSTTRDRFELERPRIPTK